jgi:hypothetical protein
MTVSERITAENNVRRNLDKHFDSDWFDERGLTALYDDFVESFTDWLIGEGVDVSSYKNMDIDVVYYLSDYNADSKADHQSLDEIYEKVGEWLQEESDRMLSREYLDGRYEAYALPQEMLVEDVNRNAKKQMESGITHGFKSAEDLKAAVDKAVEDGGLETYDVYDAGGMGYHIFNEENDWFETGCLFLGNSEEEEQLDSLPYDESVDFGDNYRYYCVKGDCMYAVSDLMYCYGVKWSDVEAAGDELGLRSGE